MRAEAVQYMETSEEAAGIFFLYIFVLLRQHETTISRSNKKCIGFESFGVFLVANVYFVFAIGRS